jgi:hypothetical protein
LAARMGGGGGSPLPGGGRVGNYNGGGDGSDVAVVVAVMKIHKWYRMIDIT